MCSETLGIGASPEPRRGCPPRTPLSVASSRLRRASGKVIHTRPKPSRRTGGKAGTKENEVLFKNSRLMSGLSHIMLLSLKRNTTSWFP